LLFRVFEQTGSALAVVKYFGEHHLRFPDRLWGKTHDGELLWKPLRHGRVLNVLHNPRYAGAYVYGRTQTRTRPLPHESARVKGRTRRVAVADWPIVRHNAHPSYLSWEQFLRNQQRLDDNCTSRDHDRRGVAREGQALLQGLVLCGQCGRRMSVRYLGKGATPSYECNQVHKEQGGRTCQSIRGDGVDAAVTHLFLEALQPAQLDVSLATLQEIEDQARQVERQWRLRLERASYEADLARRRFLAIEPEPSRRPQLGERLEREAGGSRAVATPTSRSPNRDRSAVQPRRATTDSEPGGRPAHALACVHDDRRRTQATVTVAGQGCYLDQGSDDHPRGPALANRGVHDSGSSSTATLL